MRHRLAPLAQALIFLLALPVSGEEAKKSPPRLVLLIRHAEKPPLESMSVDLGPAGRKRAETLPGLFVKSPSRPGPLLAPDFLFAAKDSKHSRRCTETVAPLAKKLRLKVNAKIANDDFAELAAEILGNPKYAGKTVLVCWHHGNLAALAKKLGASESPDRWRGTTFDRVWRIRYSPSGEATFDELPQRLLPDHAKK